MTVVPLEVYLEQLARSHDTLRREDHVHLAEIARLLLEDEDDLAIDLIYAYYRDADRSDRTPREFLYLHLGVLVALAKRP